jgi:hypothetical protein
MSSRKRETPDGDELLGRTDYFEYWLKEAEYHAIQLGWRHDHLRAVLEQIKSVFTEEILLRHATRKDRLRMTGDVGRHPIGRLIATPSASSISEILELAVYLKRCRRIPNFDEVVDMLRAARQYERALVQLALGYRLARLGLTDITFEPPTNRGRKADVSFVHRATTYILECYEPDEPSAPLVNELVQYLPDRVADKAASKNRRVIVRVELGSAELPTTVRQRIERDTHALMDSLALNGRETLVRDEYQIEAIDTSGIDPSEVEKLAWSMVSGGDWLLNRSLVDADEVPGISRGIQPESQIRQSWTIVSARARTGSIEDVRKIAAAVAKKVSQVRSEQSEALGIMVVRTPYARTVALRKPDAHQIMQTFGRTVLAPNPELAGLFLIDRGVDPNKKPYMCGAFVCIRNEDELEPVFSEIRRLEDQRDIIADWG